MRMLLRGGLGLALIAVGYVLGSSGFLHSPEAQAQIQPTGTNLNKDTQEKIKAAYEALLAARDALQNEGKYTTVTDPAIINAFGILTGGVDAKQDLETGRGVDPETFAALYADLATGEERANIEKNAQGQLTYKGKVIRMYPISTLKQKFIERSRLAGIDEKK
ncbi:MAG: hypothetical protein KDA84_20170 [Planctomycetaceae bacterium]|nr:hypothetical protein [Planctomycetaceae bacterium]